MSDHDTHPRCAECGQIAEFITSRNYHHTCVVCAKVLCADCVTFLKKQKTKGPLAEIREWGPYRVKTRFSDSYERVAVFCAKHAESFTPSKKIRVIHPPLHVVDRYLVERIPTRVT